MVRLTVLIFMANLAIGCEFNQAPDLQNEQVREKLHGFLSSTQLYRSRNIETIWSRFRVRFDFVENDRKRFEYADGTIWYQSHYKFALVANKLSETIAWIGADGENCWMFAKEDGVVTGYLAGIDDVGAQADSIVDYGVMFHPNTFMVLVGIIPPPSIDDRAELLDLSVGRGWAGNPDSDSVVFSLQVKYKEASRNYYFESDNINLIGVELLHEDGAPWIRSILSDYVSVQPHDRDAEFSEISARFPTRIIIQGVSEKFKADFMLSQTGLLPPSKNSMKDDIFQFHEILRHLPPSKIILLGDEFNLNIPKSIEVVDR